MRLYNNIFHILRLKIDFDFILNLLIKIVSKGDIFIINKFLDDLKSENEIKDKLVQILEHQQFFHWLLETSFQAYMIKESNFDEKKFVPGFCIGPINDNSEEKKHIFTKEEKRKMIDKIYQNTNEFITEIIKKNIYKLDYIITWSKYYYEMRNNKNKFEKAREYALKILKISIKIPDKIPFSDKKINTSLKEFIYFINLLLFELLTFYRLNGTKTGIKNSSQIDEELSRKFPYILFLEIYNGENKLTENDIMKTLNIKWKKYPFYAKIISFFKPLWIDIINIMKKNIGERNIFINELEIIIYSFNDIQEFSNSSLSTIYANKGLQIVYIIFHFFILISNIGGNEADVNNIYNDFRLFITLLIISSSTVNISSDSKKQKWPNESQYKDLQETTQLILCNSLNYFINKIEEINILIEKYKSAIKEHNFYINKYGPDFTTISEFENIFFIFLFFFLKFSL